MPDDFFIQLEKERQRDRDRNKRWRINNPDKARAACRDYRANNLEKVRAEQRKRSKRHALKYKYGMTEEGFASLFTSQGNRCGVCETDDPGRNGWCVDHCHDTKKVRGILCHPCNLVLGWVKDDADILQRAIDYLNK